MLDEGSPNAFRVRAYEKAADTLASHKGDLAALSERELTGIDGIGPSTAKKIREFYETGTIAKLEELRRKYPPDFVELGKIPGLGPKTLLRLRSELGVRNLEDLRAALEGRKVRAVHGLGEKLEQKLLLATARMGQSGKDKRRPIAEAMPIARELVQALEALPGVERAQYCGSLRRLRETVADVDVVVATREPSAVGEAFVQAAHGPRGDRERGDQDLGPDRDRPAGGPPDRRPAPVRGRVPVLHRLQGAQHQAAPAGPRAGLAAERVRPQRRRDRRP